jgi:hypothetical protein
VSGAVDGSGAVVGLGVAAGEHAARAPMRATARTIRLIIGNLGCRADLMPAVEMWPERPREDRTDGPRTEAPNVQRGFLAAVSQGSVAVATRETSVIDADGTVARGWQRRSPMLRFIDAAPHTGAASATRSEAGRTAEGPIATERPMIRVQPATATDDEPDDRAMRVVEVGLALLAIVAAGILALLR